MTTKLVDALIVDVTHVGSTPTRSTIFMSKQIINYDEQDIINCHVNNLLIWWMQTKHPDEVEKIKEYVEQEFKSTDD